MPRCRAKGVVGQLRARLDHVLAVVEDEEEGLRPNVVHQRIQARPALLLLDAQPRRHGVDEKCRIAKGGQLDEPNAVDEALELIGGDSERQARLARSARSGQREESIRGQQAPQLLELALASDETRELDRQIVGRSIERSQRCEAGREVRDDDLEDALGVGDVLQAVHAEVAQHDAPWQIAESEIGGRLRQQDLPSVAGRHDPLPTGQRYVALVLVVSPLDSARVQAHPGLDGRTRPPFGLQLPLGREGGRHGPIGLAESSQELIADGLKDEPVVVLGSDANDLAVPGLGS